MPFAGRPNNLTLRPLLRSNPCCVHSSSSSSPVQNCQLGTNGELHEAGLNHSHPNLKRVQMIVAPLLHRYITAKVEDSSVRHQQIRAGVTESRLVRARMQMPIVRSESPLQKMRQL